jgi:hypothetical protein
VTSLALSELKKCEGIHMSTGSSSETLTANTTILCASAYTSKLLADSAPDWQELQPGNRVVAVGALQCTATVPAEEAYKLKDVPFHFLGMWHTNGKFLTYLGSLEVELKEATF